VETICILIGNTDNKLGQGEWAHFCQYCRRAIEDIVSRVHFAGGPETSAPWQNYCWVCEIDVMMTRELKSKIASVRKSYGQDSVAVLVGETQFV
jgi:hypothetical protein